MTPRFSRRLALAVLLLPAASQAQSLLLDNFNGTVGTPLTANGWTQVGTVVTNPILVTANPLAFPNYPGVSGNAAGLTTTGQDVNRALTSAPASGAVYAAFLVNVSAAQAAGDYFFALLPSLGSNSFDGRVYARSSAGGIQFGLSKSSTSTTVLPVYTTTEYALNTTYLLVLKYSFVAGTANDPVSLFVFGAADATATEPATPTLTDPTTINDLTAAGAALLRQGTAANAPTLTFDGLRIGTSFEDAVLATRFVDDGAGYRLLGAPVQNVTVGTLAGINLVQGVAGQYPAAGDNLFLDYDGGGTSGGYVAATSTADPVVPGRGFFWYLYDQDITPTAGTSGGGTSRSYVVPERPLFASGPVNTADVSVNVPTRGDGFYMLANPFAQAIAGTGVTQTAGGGTFSTSLQAYEPATASFTLIDRTATTTNLSMWQGFFAEVQGATAPTFTYVAAARTDALPALISRAALSASLALRLDGTTAAGVGVHDEAAIVRFSDDALAGWDADDASKLVPPTAAYALVAPVGERDGQRRRQAVLSLPTGATPDVTLAFTATHAGTFTLTAEATGLPADATVRDLRTGAVARLSDGLTFTSDAAGWSERFVVALGRGATAGESAPAAFALGAVSPNPASDAARVTLRVDAAQRVTATVVDALGRTVAVVFEGALAAGAEQALVVPTARLAPGVYVVRVQGETFAQSRRLVVAR